MSMTKRVLEGEYILENPRRLLSTTDAAKYLGVSEAFLERDRVESARIPFVRIGNRLVRYEISALDAYIKSHIRKSTSQS